jgi:hypothetical protein
MSTQPSVLCGRGMVEAGPCTYTLLCCSSRCLCLLHYLPSMHQTSICDACPQVSSTFRKTAINFHYEFTVRHLANVFQVGSSWWVHGF